MLAFYTTSSDRKNGHDRSYGFNDEKLLSIGYFSLRPWGCDQVYGGEVERKNDIIKTKRFYIQNISKISILTNMDTRNSTASTRRAELPEKTQVFATPGHLNINKNKKNRNERNWSNKKQSACGNGAD